MSATAAPSATAARSATAALSLTAALVTCLACGGRPAATLPDGGDDAGKDAFVPGPPSDQLDILVLVDNSNSSFGDSALANLRLSALLAPLGAAHPGLSVQVGIDLATALRGD